MLVANHTRGCKSADTITLTIRVRLRDKHAASLRRQAKSVNIVWNYCNETQQIAVGRGRPWLAFFDLVRLTQGCNREIGLPSQTVQQTCRQYEISRRTKRRPWLRWRTEKSLGWVPFEKGGVKFDGAGFIFYGCRYEVMEIPRIPAGATIRSGSFSSDSRGRWYINCPIEFPIESFPRAAEGAIGIDLGVKSLAVLSTGETINAPQHYRTAERKIALAQRARKKRLRRSLSSKLHNRRKDFQHKLTTHIALLHSTICVGDVSSSKLAQTKLAKGVLDSGWSTLRKQLSYKAMRHGGIYIEVDERNTSQVCSSCGSKPEGRPKGIAGLGIREWTCGDCGAFHDRDVNAARNILRRGLATLAEGAPSIREQPGNTKRNGRVRPEASNA